MPICDKLVSCPFFNNLMEKMPYASELTKAKFCLTDSSGCALYLLQKKLEAKKIPKGIYPRDFKKAQNYLETFKMFI